MSKVTRTISRYFTRHASSATSPKTELSKAGSSAPPFGESPHHAGIQRLFHPHLNYRSMRDNVASIEQNIKNRGITTADARKVATLYDEFVALDFKVSDTRRRRNEIASEMGAVQTEMKKRKKAKSGTVDLDARKAALIDEGKNLKSTLHAEESALSDLQSRLFEEARHLPNDTAPDVPIGPESNAYHLYTVGAPRSNEESTTNGDAWRLRDHLDLCRMHSLADFDRSGKVSGTGFYYLKNAGCLLELALQRYAMDRCIARGFTPVCVPDVIRHEVLDACGFSPRSGDPQTYFLSSSTLEDQTSKTGKLCLSATAEFPLAAMYANEVLKSAEMPVRMVGLGRAFRAEGLAGAVNRGLYRVHQFSKVEMFALTEKGKSDAMLEEFKAIQEEIFKDLGLCFRILNMPTEELGAPAYKKYDMEAWMPGREAWGEISSSSNCTDYQSRRLNIRYRTQKSRDDTTHFAEEQHDESGNNAGLMDFAHTLNGTAAAIPRLIISLLETYQLQNGDVMIPKPLRPYFLGDHVDKITPGMWLLPKGFEERKLN